MPSLLDPYEKLTDGDEAYRTSVRTSKKTTGFLLSVHRRDGTLAKTINHCIHELRKALEQNGIDSFEPDVYEATVRSVRFTVPGTERPGSTASVQPITAAKAPSGDDRQRTGNVARQPANVPVVAPLASVAPKANRTRRVKASEGKEDKAD